MQQKILTVGPDGKSISKLKTRKVSATSNSSGKKEHIWEFLEVEPETPRFAENIMTVYDKIKVEKKEAKTSEVHMLGKQCKYWKKVYISVSKNLFLLSETANSSVQEEQIGEFLEVEPGASSLRRIANVS